MKKSLAFEFATIDVSGKSKKCVFHKKMSMHVTSEREGSVSLMAFYQFI